jgi:hypothetical protein
VNDLAAVARWPARSRPAVTVPAELAVTGYDDTFLAELRQISLTSVNPDSAGMGELAARRLLERIARPDRPGVEHLVRPAGHPRQQRLRQLPPAAGGDGERPPAGGCRPRAVDPAWSPSPRRRLEFVAQPGPEDLAIAEGAIVRADAVVDGALLARAPRLRVLARTGVGVDLVDLEEAGARGIAVVITPGAGTGPSPRGCSPMHCTWSSGWAR